MDSIQNMDSRRHLRYDVLDFAMLYGGGSDGVRALIVDLGLGGMAMRTKEPLTDLAKVSILVGHASGNPIEVTGVVRYCENRPGSPLYAVGIQFEPNGHEERLRIAKLINEAFQRSCQPV